MFRSSKMLANIGDLTSNVISSEKTILSPHSMVFAQCRFFWSTFPQFEGCTCIATNHYGPQFLKKLDFYRPWKCFRMCTGKWIFTIQSSFFTHQSKINVDLSKIPIHRICSCYKNVLESYWKYHEWFRGLKWHYTCFSKNEIFSPGPRFSHPLVTKVTPWQ